jgi:hypothetical protein
MFNRARGHLANRSDLANGTMRRIEIERPAVF